MQLPEDGKDDMERVEEGTGEGVAQDGDFEGAYVER